MPRFKPELFLFLSDVNNEVRNKPIDVAIQHAIMA